MDFRAATESYERWLARRLTLVPEDLELKHQRMREDLFRFLRATYYRWAQRWVEQPECAPKVLAVGDLHVENFGTWRDSEGRLIWGVNDFDEAWPLEYTNDLVRLAVSACLAIGESGLRLGEKSASEAILEGYREGLEAGGLPFVLGEHHLALRDLAVARLHDPCHFWGKLDERPTLRVPAPRAAANALGSLLPRHGLPYRLIHRVAGLGSLGRQRFVAIADWQGGRIAREAKAMAPSACVWAAGLAGPARIHYQEIVDRAVRCVDPYVRLKGRWIVRRLAPDCSRIELAALPRERDEARLLHAMGWETANVHLGSRGPRELLADLRSRPKAWLPDAARRMREAAAEDWKQWRAG
ncbi:MAG TPA: DUF2252 family protein [Bryobacteraceae bacterium]|nr:DUF2252 family protein [Bryobacteraceae bacterium]